MIKNSDRMDPSVFVHNNALVEIGAKIGARTRVWAFAHILPGAVVGENCNICDHVFIENDVVIGNCVTIKCGVQVWDGIKIEDNVFVGPNVTFTNDPFPRSKKYPENFSKTLIRTGASIGANSTILPGLVIGQNAMIGAGSVVTNNVSPNAIVVGNPGRVIGYASSLPTQIIKTARKKIEEVDNLDIVGVKIIKLPVLENHSGSLIFGEYNQHFPFNPKRFFIIYNVPPGEVRGEHAHRDQHQLLVCLNGSCNVVLDDGKTRVDVVLSRPDIGLHIPPMVWATQYKYSNGAILLVLASDIYDSSEYIRDYEEFTKLVG